MSASEDPARFIEDHVRRVAPLARDSSLEAWEAATTGSGEAVQRAAAARAALRKVYSNRDEASRVRELISTGETEDALLQRQLVLLDYAYTANQLPVETINDLTHREAELQAIFYNFRARLEGVPLSNNELRALLVSESDSDRRRSIWEAGKEIGPVVAPLLVELVRRRNAAAQTLGFDDYYSMELTLQEIDERQLFELLADFRARSDDAFRMLRGELDQELAERFGVRAAALRPWHWDDFFAQEAPTSRELNLDPLFAGFDHVEFVRKYFADIGLPVDDVLARSDLFEREGKDQHAFCTDIDREGDVRILCNLRPDERWMRTLLHELGHAVYDRSLPRSLPYLLRVPAHTLATEAVAMFFGRLTRDPEWLVAQLDITASDLRPAEIHARQRLSMLVAVRWMLVMVHFERELYRDPDRSDLNRLWWDLVEEFQLVARPEGRNQPDWATKIHLSLTPVYYHNYLLGELMASQITDAMRRDEGGATSPGGFLRDRIFARGASLPWNDLLRESTGRPLSAAHFVEQFVAEPSPSEPHVAIG